MIYTCTLNPSVDYVVQLDKLKLGQLNISSLNDTQPGGKGINVSRIINQFQVPNKAIGFVGGFTGEFLVSKLADEGIFTDFLKIEENTRINIKLKAKEETEINGTSPFVSIQDLEKLISKLEHLQKGDFIVLSGSIPSSLSADTYSKIAQFLSKKGVFLCVDAQGDALRSILPFHPFLIKPNHHELGDFFQNSIETVEEAKYYGRKLLDKGASNVIISMASQGALLLTKELSVHATVPSRTVVNSVGAGDSLVGGFLATYCTTNNVIEAFRYGVAAGSATAFSLGLAKKDFIDTIYNNITITTI